MLNKLWLSAFSVFFLASASSAAGINFDGPGEGLKAGLSSAEVPEASPAQDKGIITDWLFGNSHQAAQKAPAEWTIMVYINGKNDLEPYALKDMNEMEMVGSNPKMNIVVEAGRMAGYSEEDGDWKGMRRYLITKDNDVNKISSKPLEKIAKADMGDYRTLAAFGQWAKAAYPARKYMLIVWNHGSGWEKGLKDVVSKGISYDEETDNHITTPQLGMALKAIGKVDVYGSDACLMQMPEVDYELRNSADYIVGSEETEPGDGYTYNTFLGPLAANPSMSPAQLALVAVDSYANHYQQSGEGATQSFIKTSALPGLVSRVNAWVDAVMSAGLKTEVEAARTGAVSYAISDNKDLYDLVRLVSEKTENAAVKGASSALMGYITGELVLHNRYSNNTSPDNGGETSPDDKADYSGSHGISIYLPGSAAAEGYSELAWSSASRWDEFIAWSAQK